jgi:hypothetical protein
MAFVDILVDVLDGLEWKDTLHVDVAVISPKEPRWVRHNPPVVHHWAIAKALSYSESSEDLMANYSMHWKSSGTMIQMMHILFNKQHNIVLLYRYSSEL